MTAKQTYNWLRHLEKALMDLDEIPLLGRVPPFEWKELNEKLCDLLQIPGLEIKPNNWSWQTSDLLSENLGSDATCINIAVLPILGHISLMMNATDVNSLVSWIVEHKAGSNILVSSHFSEGLLNFVLMEAMHHAQSFAQFKNFMLRIVSNKDQPSSRVLVLDITLKAYKEELSCRIVVPEAFRRQWLQHFSKGPKHITKESARNIEMICSLEVARVVFTRQEWKRVQAGDFIPLNADHLDLENNTGSLYLSVNQKPLLRTRIKNNGLKILEQPIYQEEVMNMEYDHDDLLSEISDLEQEKKQALDPIPDELELDQDEVLSKDSDEDDLDLEKPISVKKESTILEKIEMVPLNVIVEISRFKMTCEKLMQLKPGNLLELDVSLEKPVDLVVNGKKIATGELVRIGETLGIQILDIG